MEQAEPELAGPGFHNVIISKSQLSCVQYCIVKLSEDLLNPTSESRRLATNQLAWGAETALRRSSAYVFV